MEKGSGSNGKRNGKAVQLNLCSPVNVQKGRTLVGRLETDKNLNRGIVISMIKKGWGLDRDMEVHEMTNNNAFLFRFSSQAYYNRILKGRPWSILGALLNLQHWDEFMVFHEVNFGWCPFWIQFHGLPHIAFDNDNAVKLGNAVGRVMLYESPKLDGKLSRTFIRTRTLVNIQEPLIPGFWVPRPQREPIWVMIKYERLQNYCYDCGRIGHEARNCKYPAASTDEEDTEGKAGNGFGIPHVKTKEDMLVVHNRGWDEGMMVQVKPPAVTAEPPNPRRLHDDNTRKGSNINHGEKSGTYLWRNTEIGSDMGNVNDSVFDLNKGKISFNDPVKAYTEKGITIVEIPTNMEAAVTPPSAGEISVKQLWKRR
ncbi:hypothetical protein K1719_042081 [Acacia pycnantha]|nr:hypothetical protein K1719_042081 [Acacia pycnantha]